MPTATLLQRVQVLSQHIYTIIKEKELTVILLFWTYFAYCLVSVLSIFLHIETGEENTEYVHRETSYTVF